MCHRAIGRLGLSVDSPHISVYHDRAQRATSSDGVMMLWCPRHKRHTVTSVSFSTHPRHMAQHSDELSLFDFHALNTWG